MRQPFSLHLATRAVVPAVLAGTVLALAAPLEAAANKEHQQMMADIRMLQEQNQQLHQTLGTLVDALKVVTTKIDEQTSTTRKSAADQKLLIDGLASELRIVREKLDDTNVRLGSISQEVDSLRNSMPTTPMMPAPQPGTEGVTPGATDPDAAAAPGTGAPPVASAPPSNPAAGMSPSKLFDLAYSDYAAGQFALAIQGFETYLRAFPRTPQADDAQFYIGESYQLDGKNKEAVQAFDRVIAEYPTGDRTADAYYKRGLVYTSMNQPDRARESFEAAIKNFPDSAASRLAQQKLKQAGGR